MEENVDVKALRARFNSPAPRSSRDSGSPKSPHPILAKPFSPVPDTNTPFTHRLSPTTTPGPSRAPPLSGLKTPPISHSGPLRAPVPPTDSNKVRATGELLQNLMLRHQTPTGPRLSPVLSPSQPPISPPVFAAHSPIRQHTAPSVGSPLRPQTKQRSGDDVAPLRRPLPPHAPAPPKPKRPVHVNLEPYRRFVRRAPPGGATTVAGPRTSSVSPLPVGRTVPIPTLPGAPRLPQRDIKPGRLPRQTTTVDMDDQEMMYDDIGSLEKNDSWSDTGSLSKEEDPDEVYEYIDEDQVEQIRAVAEKQTEERPEIKPNKKEMKRLQEQERREAQERQKREEQLRKNFQLKGEVDVLHTASVRNDWSGGSKLDLSVRQGDRVDIIRVKDNPGGKWLARSPSGNYGYISNACVDIDYDAIKRKATQIRRSERFEAGELPPPPPDPPGFNQRSNAPPPPDPPGYNQRSNGLDRVSQDEDDYDDVDAGSVWSSQDFPPPPIEMNKDPRIEKDLRKKFKFEGPLNVLHTMMVDPNAVIKKPGAKDLSVAPGDVLDVIQLQSKKALCRNKFGKFGYVNRSLLLSMEGEIYDDVEYPNDVYDNDNTDY